ASGWCTSTSATASSRSRPSAPGPSVTPRRATSRPTPCSPPRGWRPRAAAGEADENGGEDDAEEGDDDRGEAEDEVFTDVLADDNVFGSPPEDALRRDFTINALFYRISD